MLFNFFRWIKRIYLKYKFKFELDRAELVKLVGYYYKNLSTYQLDTLKKKADELHNLTGKTYRILVLGTLKNHHVIVDSKWLKINKATMRNHYKIDLTFVKIDEITFYKAG